MARQTDDQQITTRAARDRLAPRADPFWRGLDSGTAVGYRRTTSGGFWLARVMVEGRYRKGAIGRADDAIKPDGITILDYRQAAEKAKAWAAQQHRIAAGMEADHQRAPYTVADAVRDYLTAYARRGGKSLRDTQRATDALILPALGAVRLDRLSRQRVQGWLNAVADAPPRLRTSQKPGSAQRFRALDRGSPDAMRARRATANRVLTILKAALNHAHHSGRVPHDEAWALVKPFPKVDAPRVRHLDDDEATRLLAACPADLRQIVAAGLLTGMRYGEIIGMTVADFHAGAGTVSLSDSKGGHPRLIHLTDEGRTFFAAAVAGKEKQALAFRRADGNPWGRSHQFRPLREASAAARITPAIGFHVLRHTYASRLVMRGLPMAVVAAQIGDSEAICAKYYAHLSPSYVGDMVRQAFGTLGLAAAVAGDSVA